MDDIVTRSLYTCAQESEQFVHKRMGRYNKTLASSSLKGPLIELLHSNIIDKRYFVLYSANLYSDRMCQNKY